MWSDMSNHGWRWGFGPLPMLLFRVLNIVMVMILGAGIGGIVAARRSGEEGGAWA